MEQMVCADIVEALAFHQLEKLFYQVGFQGTANATVLKRYQAIVFLVYDATFLNQVGINIHFAQIVYNNGKLDSLFIRKDTVDQCGFPAAQITGQEQHRDFFCIHVD